MNTVGFKRMKGLYLALYSIIDIEKDVAHFMEVDCELFLQLKIKI